MITAVAAAHLLRLNKVLTLVSSNISIPPMIPFILYGSFYAGSLLLGESMKVIPSDLTFDAISGSLTQYLAGSIILATCVGFASMGGVYIILKIFRRSEK